MKNQVLVLALALGISSILSGCSTTQAQFHKNPEGVSKAALCRTFLEASDQQFIYHLTAELAKRRIDPQGIDVEASILTLFSSGGMHRCFCSRNSPLTCWGERGRGSTKPAAPPL